MVDGPDPSRSNATVLQVVALCCAMLCGRAAAADLPLLLDEDFKRGSERWQPTDPAAWMVVETPGGRVYSLIQQSKYQPPHRSPLNFALAKNLVVADFVLETRVQSTVKDYDHRDVVLVFGYQDPAHFYYVHFGKKTDDRANQVFIVNDAPRVKISTRTTPGTPWDDEWHTLKVVRNAASGSIDVYFDDLEHPAMTAQDKTFVRGQIGIGSFDDLANFAHVTLRGSLAPRVLFPEAGK
jgi:hypothetical protein